MLWGIEEGRKGPSRVQEVGRQWAGQSCHWEGIKRNWPGGSGSKPDELLVHWEGMGSKWASLPGYMVTFSHAKEWVLGQSGALKR